MEGMSVAVREHTGVLLHPVCGPLARCPSTFTFSKSMFFFPLRH